MTCLCESSPVWYSGGIDWHSLSAHLWFRSLNLPSLILSAFYEDGLGLALEDIYHPHPCQITDVYA